LAQSTPQELLDTFIKASHAYDEFKVQSLWDSGDWSKKADNPGHSLFRQSIHKKFTFVDQGIQVLKERALATVNVVRNGRVVDRVYLYAERKDARWVFVHADESKSHVKRFLAGTVPGRFYVRELPSNAKLDPVGRALLALALGPPGAKEQQLFTNSDAEIKEHLRAIQGNKTLLYTKNGWLKSLKRGYFRFDYQDSGSRADGTTYSYKSNWFIYVEQAGDKWHIFDDGSSPSNESFLK
jgi:hypothetical protein